MIEFHTLETRSINTVSVNASHLLDVGNALKVIKNNDRSVAYGREFAFSEGDSEFVSFIDDDDLTSIERRHIETIEHINCNALYTNSMQLTGSFKAPLTALGVKAWSLSLEKRKKTKPHQTIVYKRKYALELVKAANNLIKKKGWDANVFDYVCRALISTTDGWVYYPEVTYVWDRRTNGLHYADRWEYYDLSSFFFPLSGRDTLAVKASN